MSWPQYLRRECRFNGARVGLTPYEAEYLLVLLINRGRATSKGDILDAVYADREGDLDGLTNPTKIADVYICRLRKKLPGLIERANGVYGLGYTTGGYYIAPEDGPFVPMRTSEYSLRSEQRLAAALGMLSWDEIIRLRREAKRGRHGIDGLKN